jgi:hypothetical protein
MSNASGYGSGGVSPTGRYRAAVPLDLPVARGALPVPLAVVYDGGNRVGEAGLGWSIPYSFVHRSTSLSRRKSVHTSGGATPAPPERVFLNLGRRIASHEPDGRGSLAHGHRRRDAPGIRRRRLPRAGPAVRGVELMACARPGGTSSYQLDQIRLPEPAMAWTRLGPGGRPAAATERSPARSAGLDESLVPRYLRSPAPSMGNGSRPTRPSIHPKRLSLTYDGRTCSAPITIPDRRVHMERSARSAAPVYANRPSAAGETVPTEELRIVSLSRWRN